MKKKLLYLHIGGEKTGSTSIQHFLEINKNLLRKHGFYYSNLLGYKNNCYLPLYFSQDASERLCSAWSLPHLASRRKAYLEGKLLSYSKSVKNSNFEFFVISSEYLQSRLRSINEISKLRDYLRDLFDDIVVVYYVRDPIDSALSLYSTAVKSGFSGDMPSPTDPYFFNSLNHKSSIEMWATVFSNRLIVRNYSQIVREDTSILDDFIAQTKIVSPGVLWKKDIIKNATLNSLELAILLQINRGFGYDVHSLKSYKQRFVARYITSLGLESTPLKMSFQLRREYLEAFSCSNNWLQKNYFPDLPSSFVSSYSSLSAHDTTFEEFHSWADPALPIANCLSIIVASFVEPRYSAVLLLLSLFQAIPPVAARLIRRITVLTRCLIGRSH